jgi:hypothetical protein
LNILKKAEVEAATTAETAALQIEQNAKQKQEKILEEAGLSKVEITKEMEKIEEEKKKIEATEVEIEKTALAAETALKIAEIKASAKGGSSRKRLTLGLIQKGGRQSANRTKKSITDFFKSSVTSSRILKMILKPDEKHKRKSKVKRRRFGKRSRKIYK